MIVNDLEIKEIGTTLPPLELTPEEIETLADELAAYHAEFADLYYRIEQAQLGLPVSARVDGPYRVEDDPVDGHGP